VVVPPPLQFCSNMSEVLICLPESVYFRCVSQSTLPSNFNAFVAVVRYPL
jgi:hypothetical protein